MNVNIAFCILQSDHSIQGSLINDKGFLFRLFLAAGAELIISDLNPDRLLPQYWRLIRNDLDALLSAFPTIMIATGLNVLELLSITMVDYSSTSSMWLWHSGERSLHSWWRFRFEWRHGRPFIVRLISS